MAALETWQAGELSFGRIRLEQREDGWVAHAAVLDNYDEVGAIRWHFSEDTMAAELIRLNSDYRRSGVTTAMLAHMTPVLLRWGIGRITYPAVSVGGQRFGEAHNFTPTAENDGVWELPLKPRP